MLILFDDWDVLSVRRNQERRLAGNVFTKLPDLYYVRKNLGPEIPLFPPEPTSQTEAV